ncbi:MAG: TolC family protein [Nitrospirota bacterium]
MNRDINTMTPIVLLALGWLGLPAGVGAAPTTLGQAYTLALERSEDVRIGEHSVRQAEEEIRRARSTVLPQLTVRGTYWRYPEESGPIGIIQPRDSYSAEATLEQALYAGGKNSAGLRIAKQGVGVAGADLRLSREAVLLRVAQVFYDALRAQKNVEIQTHNVERLTEHRRLSELRYKVGEVTESILLRAEAELAGAKAELVARQNDRAIAGRELQLLTGLPDPVEVADPPLPRIADEAVEHLRTVAQDAREELLKSRLQERIGQDRVAFARANLFPTLTAEGTLFKRGQNPESPFFLDQSWAVGARLEFPLFDGGLRRAELRQARARLEQGQLATAKLAKQVDLDVTRARGTLDAVTRALESRLEQRRFAAKNYQMVSKQFTFGLATNLDVLDANQALIEAERDVIGATYDQHLAILELQRSVGRFLSEAEAAMPKESM